MMTERGSDGACSTTTTRDDDDQTRPAVVENKQQCTAKGVMPCSEGEDGASGSVEVRTPARSQLARAAREAEDRPCGTGPGRARLGRGARQAHTRRQRSRRAVLASDKPHHIPRNHAYCPLDSIGRLPGAQAAHVVDRISVPCWRVR